MASTGRIDADMIVRLQARATKGNVPVATKALNEAAAIMHQRGDETKIADLVHKARLWLKRRHA